MTIQSKCFAWAALVVAGLLEQSIQASEVPRDSACVREPLTTGTKGGAGPGLMACAAGVLRQQW
jgi:hypothetical protein